MRSTACDLTAPEVVADPYPWRDREPAASLEPFSLLHRHQMMENEPPEHTRLRVGA